MIGKLTAVEGRIKNQVYVIPEEGELTLGRIGGNNIVVADPHISRQHCKFYNSPNGFMVEDLGSSNGVHVNNERKKLAALEPGARIRVGPVLFDFAVEEITGAALPTRAMPTPQAAASAGDVEKAVTTVRDRPPKSPPPAAAAGVQCAKCSKSISSEEMADGSCRKIEGRLVCPQCSGKLGLVGLEFANYRVLKLLGKGGVGAVYKAQHRVSKQVVALKVLHAEVASGETAAKRFEREARTGAQLHHANITAILDLGVENGQQFIAMEFVEGECLHDVIQRERQLSQQKGAQYIGPLADALYHAHQADIVHRDIKPANILISKDDIPKLTDLGLAKSLSDPTVQVTAMGTAVGTPGYMAPEQATSGHNIDYRVDIYALGATLYHTVTGCLAFPGRLPLEILKNSLRQAPQDPRTHNPSLSAEFVAVVLKAMAKDPGGRFASAKEMADSLSAFA